MLDWIVDDPLGSQLMDLVERRVVCAIVAADNAHEVHRIPDGKVARRERLQALLKANFIPLAPTHVPIAGIARAGLARIATPYVMSLRDQLRQQVGIEGLDSNHLINASREGCDLFLTLDKAILRKRHAIQRILSIECLEPGDLLQRLHASRSDRGTTVPPPCRT
ncbi:MAG: hypothetical protein AB7O37_18955 [Vicinamibacteria bacterium]